jgi:hypothetical protein
MWPMIGPDKPQYDKGVLLMSSLVRSRWWTLLLIIPGVNLLAYWFYAFTLPRNDVSFA